MESLIDSAFPFEASNDTYLQMEEWTRHPLVFMANKMGDVMYYHQEINQPDAWEFSQALVKKVNGIVSEGVEPFPFL